MPLSLTLLDKNSGTTALSSAQRRDPSFAKQKIKLAHGYSFYLNSCPPSLGAFWSMQFVLYVALMDVDFDVWFFSFGGMILLKYLSVLSWMRLSSRLWQSVIIRFEESYTISTTNSGKINFPYWWKFWFFQNIFYQLFFFNGSFCQLDNVNSRLKRKIMKCSKMISKYKLTISFLLSPCFCCFAGINYSLKHFISLQWIFFSSLY